MAKKQYTKKQHDTGKSVTTKSFFGSHAEMVVDHSSFNLTLSDNEVLCKDDSGYYVTLRDRLDNGLADPKRFSGNRLQEI